jgi:hypothetical protein
MSAATASRHNKPVSAGLVICQTPRSGVPGRRDAPPVTAPVNFARLFWISRIGRTTAVACPEKMALAKFQGRKLS